MNAQENYPALMAYIQSRSELSTAHEWYSQLRLDEQQAINGGFAKVATDLRNAQRDYAAQQQAKGCEDFPYNRTMGEYLGLPIRANGEPPHGYYMATQIAHYFALGVAQRRAAQLIAEGKILKVVTGRSAKTREPIRYARFSGNQISIQGSNVIADNGKQRIKLSSNWSVETCLEKLVKALESGNAYGQTA